MSLFEFNVTKHTIAPSFQSFFLFFLNYFSPSIHCKNMLLVI